MITADIRDFYAAVPPPADGRDNSEWSYLRLASSGLEFAVTVALLTFLGVWLDGRFATTPVLTIVLAVLGFLAATWNLLRSFPKPEAPQTKPDERP